MDKPKHSGESQRSAIDTVRACHEATKHRLKAYAPGPGFLDWDNQPDLFRRRAGAPLHRLPLVDGSGLWTYQGLYQRDTQPAPLAEGAWAWRHLHWEAGPIGQVLYLEAGAQASWQVLYHFTEGRALDDERLTSEPAYAHLGAEQRAQGEPS